MDDFEKALAEAIDQYFEVTAWEKAGGGYMLTCRVPKGGSRLRLRGMNDFGALPGFEWMHFRDGGRIDVKVR